MRKRRVDCACHACGMVTGLILVVHCILLQDVRQGLCPGSFVSLIHVSKTHTWVYTHVCAFQGEFCVFAFSVIKDFHDKAFV